MVSIYQLGRRDCLIMAWTPKYIDRPLRFLYDPEVWGISFAFMILLLLFGVNQTLSLFAAVAVGYVVQKVVNHNKPGYILHVLHYIGLLKLFCPYGRYRF